MSARLQKWLSVTLIIGTGVLLVLAVTAVGQTTDVGAQNGIQTPTAEPGDAHDDDDHEATPEVTEEERALIETGRQIFLENNCAVCHGENAEGTDLAPALAGHSETAVRRQVRAPTGNMPVYPPDKISSTELDALAAYVAQLEGEDDHPHPVGELGSMVTQHLWMALYVLEDEDTANVADALHHIRHVIELVDEPQRAELEAVEHDLPDGNIHDAGHAIEDILADTPELETSPEVVHLQLTLAAVRVEDVEDAVHHLDHFLDATTGEQHEQGEEILTLLEDEDLAGAERRLEAMVGTALEEAEQEDQPVDDRADEESQADHDK